MSANGRQPDVPHSTTSPVSLLEAARSFYDTANRMLTREGDLPYQDQIHAFYLLAGFGIEVALKSHLRMLGVDDFPVLRREIGHDLNKAMLAVAERLDENDHLPARLSEVIRVLGPHHKSLAMRYTPASGKFSLPHPRVTISVLHELVDAMAYRLLVAGLTKPV